MKNNRFFIFCHSDVKLQAVHAFFNCFLKRWDSVFYNVFWRSPVSKNKGPIFRIKTLLVFSPPPYKNKVQAKYYKKSQKFHCVFPSMVFDKKDRATAAITSYIGKAPGNPKFHKTTKKSHIKNVLFNFINF